MPNLNKFLPDVAEISHSLERDEENICPPATAFASSEA